MTTPSARQGATGTPPAEFAIDAALVRALLEEAHPDLASLPLSPFDEGWDNVMFRLGDEMLVRLPRREKALDAIRVEIRHLSSLADRLPLPVSRPLRHAPPSARFPMPWTVVPDLPGETADRNPPSPDEAMVLADFLSALHREAQDAPRARHRGCPLAIVATDTEARLGRLAAKTDLIGDRVMAAWHDGLRQAPSAKSVWIPGDLHPRNVLVEMEAEAFVPDGK